MLEIGKIRNVCSSRWVFGKIVIVLLFYQVKNVSNLLHMRDNEIKEQSSSLLGLSDLSHACKGIPSMS